MPYRIAINIPKLSICLSVGGQFRRLTFNDMDEQQALQLLPQYGFRPDQVFDLRHVVHTHYRQLDADRVQELVERYFGAPLDTPPELLTPAQRRLRNLFPNNQQRLLAAIRLAMPSATRIEVRSIGLAPFEVRSKS